MIKFNHFQNSTIHLSTRNKISTKRKKSQNLSWITYPQINKITVLFLTGHHFQIKWSSSNRKKLTIIWYIFRAVKIYNQPKLCSNPKATKFYKKELQQPINQVFILSKIIPFIHNIHKAIETQSLILSTETKTNPKTASYLNSQKFNKHQEK